MEMRHHLLAVMPDDDSADRLARRLLNEGIAVQPVTDATDEADALRSEMAAETNDAVVSPQGVFIASKEGMRGTVLFTVIGSVIAVLIAAPVALIDVGLNYWARFVIEASFLVFMVFLIAYVLGGAWAWNPEQPLAVERGVLLRVDDTSQHATALILEASPIRVDEVTADGRPVATIHTEGDRADNQWGPKIDDTVEHVRDAVDEQRRADPTEQT
jgi:hypothetical protein